MKQRNISNILHTPDAAEGATEVQTNDPLSQAAGSIDTSFPLLPEGKALRLNCKSSTISSSKADAARDVLTIIGETTEDTVFKDGKKCRSGYKLYKRYSITPSEPHDGKEGRTIENVAKDLAFVIKAFYGPKTDVTPRQLIKEPAMLEAKPFDAKTTIEKGSGGFPDKNSFTFMIPAT
jgi:hypothetical protein